MMPTFIAQALREGPLGGTYSNQNYVHDSDVPVISMSLFIFPVESHKYKVCKIFLGHHGPVGLCTCKFPGGSEFKPCRHDTSCPLDGQYL